METMKVGKTFLIVLLIISACARPTGEVPQEEKWRCPSVPETFEETDLIGTWQSRYHTGSVTDTLILRGDGTYQQIYDDQLANYYYTSPWNRWYVEHRSSGGLYLHLEGMHYCLSTDEICRREGGGGGDWSYYDRCEGQTIWTMGDEVILAITGIGDSRFPGVKSAPRGVLLWHMKSSDYGDRVFILQE
jgi:hypothetical protein